MWQFSCLNTCTDTMPSKDALCFISKNDSSTQQRDLDELVFQIKEKLRVKAQPPSHSSCSEKNRLRASPYSIPSRGGVKCSCCDSRKCMHRCYSDSSTSLFSRTDSSMSRQQLTDDPYEALQELLRDGDLIKEAVRRLNINYIRSSKEKSNRVFYDSDEERTPYPFKVEV